MILRPQDKAEIIKIAGRVLSASVEVLAYGSRVDGTAYDTSDLDLALRSKGGHSIDTKELAAFRQSLHDSNIPILIQVVDWNTIPENFRQNILKNYVVLYESKPGAPTTR
ncbi:MAG: nucleotidyltransferase domain-containing protein [Bacteriovoracales bacterium]|nr:nucleotidyltransferase domain-containing protein [Bacteriovoracales bacterium]